MVLDCAARTLTYALKRPADIKVKILESHLQGTLLSINQRECWSQLIGAFNAYNMAAMYGVAIELGIPADEALQALSAVRSVDGRFQKVAGPEGRMGIVDYAHTPDALENVLKTLQELNQGAQQIITVVGCGGDRDKGKRPEMARIAADRSTKAILTKRQSAQRGSRGHSRRHGGRIGSRAEAPRAPHQRPCPSDQARGAALDPGRRHPRRGKRPRIPTKKSPVSSTRLTTSPPLKTSLTHCKSCCTHCLNF